MFLATNVGKVMNQNQYLAVKIHIPIFVHEINMKQEFKKSCNTRHNLACIK